MEKQEHEPSESAESANLAGDDEISRWLGEGGNDIPAELGDRSTGLKRTALGQKPDAEVEIEDPLSHQTHMGG